MIDAVLKAKWLATVGREMGMLVKSAQITLGTDSSAAKSFVGRRGLGKMRHIEIRDLWLQKEVREGRVRVEKIPGEKNPADLMTKYLGVDVIRQRLGEMNLRVEEGNPVKRVSQKERKDEKVIGKIKTKKRWADDSVEGEAVADDEACRQALEWWLKRIP